jgi:hypothetical protein
MLGKSTKSLLTREGLPRRPFRPLAWVRLVLVVGVGVAALAGLGVTPAAAAAQLPDLGGHQSDLNFGSVGPAHAQQPAFGWYGAEQNILSETFDRPLRIVWERSYVYPSPRGTDRLYWYALIRYENYRADLSVDLACAPEKAPLVFEHMRGTSNSGAVQAEETTCTRDPNWKVTIPPRGNAYQWAIFHNVPWSGGTAAIEWPGIYDNNTSTSAFIDPYACPWGAGHAPPAEWPPELCNFGLCP